MASTRERLVTATNELFRRRGYHGTGLKEITTAAAATTGSLYHYFPGGKRELARAVLIESGESYRQLFELIADEADSAADGVLSFFDGAAQVLEDSDFIDLCPIGTVAREVASTDEDLRLVAATVFDSWVDSAARRLERDGIDPATARELAEVLVTTLEGGFLLARSRRDAGVLRRLGPRMGGLVDDAVATSPSPRGR